MTLAVAGLNTSRFASPLANTVRIGKNAARLVSGARPYILDGPRPRLVLSPGYVTAITNGSAVWREKYIGNIAAWRVENCGRGNALKATMPAINVW